MNVTRTKMGDSESRERNESSLHKVRRGNRNRNQCSIYLRENFNHSVLEIETARDKRPTASFLA